MYLPKCSPMARETRVQSQIESYQRLKNWYLMPPCLTLSIIRYGSRIKWNNPGTGVAPSPTPWCSSYRKGSLQVALNYGHQLYFLLIYPTPPPQGQFISGVKFIWIQFVLSKTGCLNKVREHCLPYYLSIAGEGQLVYTFPKIIRIKGNTDSLV